MSTVVVVKKNGFVAIAADTLISYGSRRLTAAYNAHAGKILRIGDSYVGLVGSSAHKIVLEHLFNLKGEAPALSTKEEIFDLFRTLHPRLKQEYFLTPKDEDGTPYESSQMTLLFANRHGIFGLFSLRDVFEYRRFWSNGSGSEYALGAMHAVYDTTGDVRQIAEAGARAAIEFDECTDAPIESHVVQLVDVEAVDEGPLLLQV